MLAVSLHASPERTSFSTADGTISSRQAEGLDEIAEQLRHLGVDARVIEGPVSAAPDSDFWIVLYGDLDWHLASVPNAKEVAKRFVIINPGRERGFPLMERLDSAAALEILGPSEWEAPVLGKLLVRREVANRLGGETRVRLPFMKLTERHGAWEHPEYATAAEHLVRYLEAIGSRERS